MKLRTGPADSDRFSRVVCAAAICLALAVLNAAERPRLAVLTDIGADPDDQQSMIRLMVYANEFDLELLIATGAGTPGELKEAITRPDLIRQISTPMGGAAQPAAARRRVADGRIAARTGDVGQSPSRPRAHRRRPRYDGVAGADRPD